MQPLISFISVYKSCWFFLFNLYCACAFNCGLVGWLADWRLVYFHLLNRKRKKEKVTTTIIKLQANNLSDNNEINDKMVINFFMYFVLFYVFKLFNRLYCNFVFNNFISICLGPRHQSSKFLFVAVTIFRYDLDKLSSNNKKKKQIWNLSD